MAYIWDTPGWNSGAKVRRSGWERGHYIYRKDDGTWVYNSQYAPISSEGIGQVARTVMNDNDWELYIEPPAEVEVFEWMYQTSHNTRYVADRLMTEAEAAEYFGGREEYRKTGRSFKVPVTK